MYCDNCNSIIIFGGIKQNGFHFCGKKCQHTGQYKVLAKEISDSDIENMVNKIYYGECSYCGQTRNNNLYSFYYITSLIFFTRWSKKHKVCCKSCARKSSLGAAIYSLFFGWWGFPWGLTTPITVFKNLYYVFNGEGNGPNNDLKQYSKELVAQEIINNNLPN